MSIPVTNGLVLHLDASAIIGLNNNDLVATWEDLSASENDVLSPLGEEPIYTENAINGSPAIWFENGYRMIVPNHATLHSMTHLYCFMVLVETTITGIRHFLAGGTWALYGFDANCGLYISTDEGDGDWANNPFQVSSIEINTPYIFMGTWNANDEEGNIYFNGEGGSPQSRTGTQIGSTVAVKTLSSLNNPIEGYMGEVLVYNEELSAREINQINQYLGQKWLGWELNSYILQRKLNDGTWETISEIPVGV